MTTILVNSNDVNKISKACSPKDLRRLADRRYLPTTPLEKKIREKLSMFQLLGLAKVLEDHPRSRKIVITDHVCPDHREDQGVRAYWANQSPYCFGCTQESGQASRKKRAREEGRTYRPRGSVSRKKQVPGDQF